MEYYVTWAIHLDADSHEDAARKAYEMQQRQGNDANVFNVLSDDDDERPVTVDLFEMDNGPDHPAHGPGIVEKHKFNNSRKDCKMEQHQDPYTAELLAGAIDAQLALWSKQQSLEMHLEVIGSNYGVARIANGIRVFAGLAKAGVPAAPTPTDVAQFVNRVVQYRDKPETLMNIDAAAIAAFMCGGLFTSSEPNTLAKILDHWDGGHYELVICMSKYALYANDLINAGYAVVGGYPGVPNYEVSEPFGHWFGQWFGEQILATRGPLCEPDDGECRFKLKELVFEFFTSDHTEKRDELWKAIAAVH